MDFRICNGLTWIYRFFTRVREICHDGSVDILGLDIENPGLNSVILRFSGVQAPISVFWSLNSFTDFQQRIVWFSRQMSWIPKFALLGLSVSWYQSGHCNVLQWYVIIQETDFCFPESYLNKTIKPPVQLETLPVYCFLVSPGGCCVALRSIARFFQVASVLSNAMGLLHLDIHVFLESRLVALNIWSPEPFRCVIQWFALHFMQMSHETKDFWMRSVSGFVWFWTDDLFPGVDCIAPCALCHACAHSESTLASYSSAMNFSLSCGWQHSRPSGESQSMIDHSFSGFPYERSR